MAVLNPSPDEELLFNTSFFPGANDQFVLESGIASQNFFPGFSDVPLVVDVYGATPQPTYVAPGALEETNKMDFLDQLSGPVDFPGAPSIDPLSSLILGGFNLASNLIQNTPAPVELPTISQSGNMVVNSNLCPVVYTPAGKLVRQHPRKQQVKARKSPVRACVTNRHMNSLNPKALRRATTRLKGFMGHVHSAQKAIRHALGHTVASGGRRRAAPRGGCFTCGRSARSCVC